MLPFVFSALSMNAVGRAAMAMIEEVRRQFKAIPELKNALEVMRKYDSDMSKASEEDRAIFDKADGKASTPSVWRSLLLLLSVKWSFLA